MTRALRGARRHEPSFLHKSKVDVMGEIEFGADFAPLSEDAVGIVVQNAKPVEQRPRAVAFVYGAKVRPQPSLPYGRWKPAVLTAA